MTFQSLLRFFPLAVLTAGLCSCERQEVNLVFNTQNVTETRYKLDSQLKVIVGEDSNSGPMESMNTRLQATISSGLVVAYDDGSGRFLMQADSVRYNSDQRSVEECRHIERSLALQEFQFKMARDGQMKDVKMAEFIPDLDKTDLDLRRLLVKIQPVLPGTPVVQGATWERQHAMDEDDGRQAFIYKWFRVEDIFERNGTIFAKMQMNVKYRIADLDSSLRQPSSEFVLGSGSVLFNVTQGQIEEGMLEINGKMKVYQDSTQDSAPDMRVRQVISLRRES